jgi:hypothetical protein
MGKSAPAPRHRVMKNKICLRLPKSESFCCFLNPSHSLTSLPISRSGGSRAAAALEKPNELAAQRLQDPQHSSRTASICSAYL